MNDDRREEAARWIVMLDRRMMTQDQRAAFQIWYSDPTNAATFGEVKRTWVELNSLRGLGYRLDSDYAPSGIRRREILTKSAKIAAMFAAVSLGASLIYRLSDINPIESDDELVAETAIGEQRSIALADGSVASLNVASRLKYRLLPSVRSFVLESGQAEFMVAADNNSPFIVRARRRSLRTFGGIFDVRIRAGLAELAVREGEVSLADAAVDMAAPWPRDATVLHSGQMISYAGSQMMPVHSVEPQSIGEWRDRVVSFNNAPLRDVVRELNLYFPGRISFQNPELGERRVTMRLEISDRDQTVEKIARLLSLEVSSRSGEVILSARNMSGPI